MFKKKSAVFLLAHQDDEFAVFSAIESNVSLGHEVYCWYLTDGALRGQPPSPRNLESLAVLSKLGVHPVNVTFLGECRTIEDGKLHTQIGPAFNAVVESAAKLDNIAFLYVPAWEGGHQDHDATHLVGLALAVRLAPNVVTYQFPLYNGARLWGSLFRVAAPLRENGDVLSTAIPWEQRWRYLQLCLGYPSQWKSWVGLFPFVAYDYLIFGRQYLQHMSYRCTKEKPHCGRLLYERRTGLSYDDFRSAVEPFIQTSIIHA